MLLRFKPETKVEQLDTMLLRGILGLCFVFKETTGRNELTITSVNEGKHKPDSLHYKGKAVDLRCNDMPDEQVAAIVARFKYIYDAEYDLVWEGKDSPNEHLHLEHDPGNKNHEG